jgi:hypothetical protein
MTDCRLGVDDIELPAIHYLQKVKILIAFLRTFKLAAYTNLTCCQ